MSAGVVNPAALTGRVKVSADGKEYTLFFGTTAIAEVQRDFGSDFIRQVESMGETGDLPAALVNGIFAAALRRYHAAEIEADPYIVDDLLLQNAGALGSLLEVAFGRTDAGDRASGNVPAAGKGKAA